MSKSTQEIAAEILIAAIPRIPGSTRDTAEKLAEDLGNAFKTLHRAVQETHYDD